MRITRKMRYILALTVAILGSERLMAQSVTTKQVLNGTQLQPGFGMGVNSSGNLTNWLSQGSGQMQMAYPAGQSWGAVFVTVGNPVSSNPPGIDLSAYQTLVGEVRGDQGNTEQTVQIGIKDTTDLNDGSETKVTVPVFANWTTYTIPLSSFPRENLSEVYVVTEFVFAGSTAENIWFDKIEFTSAPAASVTAAANGASFLSGASPNTWTSIFGQNLSPGTGAWESSDFVGSQLPTALDGISVNLNGANMVVEYISPTQINTLIPSNVPTGQAYVSVTNALGTSVPLSVTIQPTFPALFTFSPGGTLYAAAEHLDGTLVGPPGLYGPSVTLRPAAPGEIIEIWGTGFGLTNPADAPGQLVQTPLPLADLSIVHIEIGNTPATVGWGGLTESGLYQFNVTVPNVPDGDQPITIDLAGVTTQPNVFVTVKQ